MRTLESVQAVLLRRPTESFDEKPYSYQSDQSP